MIYGVVYRITCIENGKCYIGRTKNVLRVRWQQHCYSSSYCLYLKHAIQKYGKESFTIEAIASSWDAENLKELEALLIDQEHTLVPQGYNLRKDTREGVTEVSEETRAKLRGRRPNSGWFKKGCAPNSTSFKNGNIPFVDFQHKPNSTSFKKGNNSHTGIPCSEETKRKLSIANRGSKPNSGSFKKGHPPPKTAFKKGTPPWNKGSVSSLPPSE